LCMDTEGAEDSNSGDGWLLVGGYNGCAVSRSSRNGAMEKP